MPIVYCGTKLPIPLNYLRWGTPYECLRKGVGVGKYLVPPRHLNNANNANIRHDINNNPIIPINPINPIIPINLNYPFVYLRNLRRPILFIGLLWVIVLLLIYFLP